MNKQQHDQGLKYSDLDLGKKYTTNCPGLKITKTNFNNDKYLKMTNESDQIIHIIKDRAKTAITPKEFSQLKVDEKSEIIIDFYTNNNNKLDRLVVCTDEKDLINESYEGTRSVDSEPVNPDFPLMKTTHEATVPNDGSQSRISEHGAYHQDKKMATTAIQPNVDGQPVPCVIPSQSYVSSQSPGNMSENKIHGSAKSNDSVSKMLDIINKILTTGFGLDVSNFENSKEQLEIIQDIFSFKKDDLHDGFILFLKDKTVSNGSNAETSITKETLQGSVECFTTMQKLLNDVKDRGFKDMNQYDRLCESIVYASNNSLETKFGIVEESAKNIDQITKKFSENLELYVIRSQVEKLVKETIDGMIKDKKLAPAEQHIQPQPDIVSPIDKQLYTIYQESGTSLLEDLKNEYQQIYPYIKVSEHIAQLEPFVMSENSPESLRNTFDLIRVILGEPLWPQFNLIPFESFEKYRSQMIGRIKERARNPTENKNPHPFTSAMESYYSEEIIRYKSEITKAIQAHNSQMFDESPTLADQLVNSLTEEWRDKEIYKTFKDKILPQILGILGFVLTPAGDEELYNSRLHCAAEEGAGPFGKKIKKVIRYGLIRDNGDVFRQAAVEREIANDLSDTYSDLS